MFVQCVMNEICAEEEDKIQQTDPQDLSVVVLDWGIILWELLAWSLLQTVVLINADTSLTDSKQKLKSESFRSNLET